MFTRDHITDSWLVRRALAGRSDSFNKLVNRHINAVYAVAFAHTRNHADAEDIVQEAFVQAYSSLNQLREPGKFCGWVTTIARNGASRLQVRRKREASALGTRQAASPSDAPDPAQTELHAILRNQLDELDPDAREVLLMHYFAGYSAREIGVRLEISREAALKRLQRSREKLANAVLKQLEGSLDSRRESVKRRESRIIRALAAMSVPWATQKASATVATRLALVSTGCVVAAIAFTALVIGQDPDTAKGKVEPVEPRQSSVLEVNPQPTIVVEAPQALNVAEVESLPNESIVEPPSTPTLDGLWTLHQPQDGNWDPSAVWPAVATVELVNLGDELALTEVASKQPSAVRRTRGEIDGNVVTFSLLDILAIMFDAESSAAQIARNPVLRGSANASCTRIHLDGLLPDYNAPDDVPPMEFQVVMIKLDEDEAKLERFIQTTGAETQKVRDAIVAYAYDHNGRLPNVLSVLIPRYLDDSALVTDNDQRTISYNPKAFDLMTAARHSSELDTYRPELSERDRLIAWEQELTDHYGDQFPAQADLLRVRIGKTPVEIRAGFHGAPKIQGPNRVSLGQRAAKTDGAEAARVESGACMHQIKEAGLGLALFWQRSEEHYNPAGWRTLVPEFIENPSLLTCPSDEPGTLSYEMIFPAFNRAELTAIYADVNGLDPAAVNPNDVSNAIPLVYGTKPHNIDGRDFRVVLFLDGHVGLFHDRDWAKFVEPYLHYSVQ